MPRKSQPQPQTTRGRSRSTGRIPKKTSSRSPSRSQSRSRTSKPKRSRTPASESKLRRRRSPSSSSSEASPVVLRPRRPAKPAPSAAGDTPRPAVILKDFTHRDPTPTRVSQRIVEKIEQSKCIPVHESYLPRRPTVEKPACAVGVCASLRQRASHLADWWCKHICLSPLIAALQLFTIIPMMFWLNLLIFAPAPPVSAENASAPVKFTQTYWGPSFPYAKVLWPIDWRAYFDPYCGLGVITYMFLHILIARFVPIGRLVSSTPGSRRLNYRCNGIVAFLLFMSLFAAVQRYGDAYLHGFKPSALLPKYWLALLATSSILMIILSIRAYLSGRRTSRANATPEGNTGNFFIDFWVGRTLRPRWFGLDFKIFMIRPGATVQVMIELAYACAQWERYGRLSPALAAVVAMHFIYILDGFLFEHTALFTYEAYHQGVGAFFFFGYLLGMPFLLTITASYLSLRPDVGRLAGSASIHSCDAWRLGGAALLFLIGYWIYRASNLQKDRFRREPHHPSLAALDTITGPDGQRLLAGGWWGLVRHPNYLGDILMGIAAAIPCGCASVIPWIHPTLLVIFLVHRTWQDEAVCAQKHGAAYTKYTSLVRKRLIPKIF